MKMRMTWLVIAAASVAGCSGNNDVRSPGATATVLAVEPAKIAGDYEIWICESAECGPGAQMTSPRVGRLILLADRVVDPAGASYGGCVNIAHQPDYDPSAGRTRIAWQPADTAGQLRFAIDRSATAEYDIWVRDEGGMLRGRGLWRRDGVLNDEHPTVVVARRLAEVTAAACPPPEPAAVTPAPGPPLKSVPPKP